MDYGDNTTNSDDEIYTVTLLSEDRQQVVNILLVISAVLSILGSSTIIYKILRNIKKATPYDRIMLGLSGCDIVGSFAYVLSPLLPPKSTSERIWSIGNNATCSFLGFITQFAFAAVMYNAMLSFYYLLIVRYNVKRQVFAKKYEIYMHIVCLVFGLGTAGIGVLIGLFSEVDVGCGCWVNDYPAGCTEPDSPDCAGEIYGIIYAVLPTLFAFLSLAINNCCIYLYVRKTLGTINEPTKKTSESKTEDPSSCHVQTTISSSEKTGLSGASGGVWRSQQKKINAKKMAFPVPHSPAYNDRIQEVATQGLLYVGSFVVVFTPAFIFKIKDAYRPKTFDENDIFGLCVLMSITLPLQGFFNMFVYNRPNYTRIRRAYPELSTLTAIRYACLSRDIPHLTEVVVSSHSFQTPSAKRKKRSVGTASKNQGGLARSSDSGASSFWSNLDIIPEDSKELQEVMDDIEVSSTEPKVQESISESLDHDILPSMAIEKSLKSHKKNRHH